MSVELKSDAFSSFGSTYGMTEDGLLAANHPQIMTNAPRSARRISFLDDMMLILPGTRDLRCQKVLNLEIV